MPTVEAASIDGVSLRYNNGTVTWMRNGMYHRYVGMAVIFPVEVETSKNTKIRGLWYINNKQIEETEYKLWLADNGMDIENLSDEDKMLIDIVWK